MIAEVQANETVTTKPKPMQFIVKWRWGYGGAWRYLQNNMNEPSTRANASRFTASVAAAVLEEIAREHADCQMVVGSVTE